MHFDIGSSPITPVPELTIVDVLIPPAPTLVTPTLVALALVAPALVTTPALVALGLVTPTLVALALVAPVLVTPAPPDPSGAWSMTT